MSRHPLLAAFAVLCLTACAHALPIASRPMQLGIDADNWSGQIQNPAFASSLIAMNIDFISWHIQPEEEADPSHLLAIVKFCRLHHWHYLFNTEVGNYRRDLPALQHPDGTYRFDLAEKTLVLLRNDPLFLGVVYDETDLMQSLLGVRDEKGAALKPYLADTRNMAAPDAFLAVANKITQLSAMYRSYGKRLIFEMTFPDYPFAVARGGAILAPKLLKENFNDLMLAVYRGAALEYHSSELWACADLWFLDKFPTAGKYGPGFHTPQQLLEALQFADIAGFDYVYIEQVKALLDGSGNLTDYGKKVIEFQTWRKTHPHGDWRAAPIQYYVKRFPDGYWGQDASTMIPDHPYGSWRGNPYRQADIAWFHTLNQLSHGVIPIDADTWNAVRSPGFKDHPYQPMAGLPPMVVFDHFGTIPAHTKATVIDLCSNQTCR
jgi:hypothetical protein